LTATAFDEEGYYIIGDALKPVDAEHFERGLLFDGRVAEDFKLSTGTWVNAGAIRLRAIAAPLVQDAVVAGHDRDSVGLLLFPNIWACRQLCSDLENDTSVERVLSDARIRERIRAGLTVLRSHGQGSSTYATRALVMAEPPSGDAGEITDKGSVNQRIVLERRKGLVEALYSITSREDVVDIESETRPPSSN
jgi:feruloyl-CoA synthase